MKHLSFILLAMLGLALVTGCDEDKTKPATAPITGGEPAKTVTETAKDITKKGTDAVNQATDAAAKAAEELKGKVAEIRKNPIIDTVIKALEAGKADEADTALKGAEATKLALPAEIQKILPKLRAVVDKVKAGGKFEMKMLEDLWK